MRPIVVRLTKLSDDRHRFAVFTPDGGARERELETRSLLLHDLAHYALELEAGLSGGFYGGLASGGDLDTSMDSLSAEALVIERVVAPLTAAFKERRPPEEFATRLLDYFEQVDQEPPPWLDVDLLERALRRLNSLTGRWKATPFGGTMELAFPAGSAGVPT